MEDVDWADTLEEISEKIRLGSVEWAIENVEALIGELQVMAEALRSDLARQES